MVFSWKKAIEESDKHNLRRCKILAKHNEDYRIKFNSEARDADSSNPKYVEMKQRLKLEREKNDAKVKLRHPNRFLNKIKEAQKNG